MFMKISSLVIALLIPFFFPILAKAQDYTTRKTASKKAKSYFEKARKKNREGAFSEALEQAEKAIEKEPLFVDAYMLKGGILYDIGNLAEAEKTFEEIISFAADYSKTTYYKLGLTELKQKKYTEAITHLEQFMIVQQRNTKTKANAKRHLITAKFAAEATKNPVPFTPQSLGAGINTPAQEYLPAINAEGNELIFTRRINRQEDFFVSQFQDGAWQEAVPISTLNSPLSEGAHTLSADGRMLFFTGCNYPKGQGSCDLYLSVKEEDGWGAPMNLGPGINTDSWDGQPAFSADGSQLFFSSDRPGSIGGRDLWKMQKNAAGKWTRPQNLGATINTGGHEETPFIHPDGQTLYFTSKGHPGMGGADLFISRLQEDGSWGTPQNLGYPINTEANEGTMVVGLDGQKAYFARDAANALGNSVTEDRQQVSEDLFQFDLYEAIRPHPATYVKAKVVDALTRRPIVAKVVFDALPNNEELVATSTYKDGTFLTCLPLGASYALHVEREGYLFHSENFSLDSTRAGHEPFLLTIELQRVPKTIAADTSETTPLSKPIILKNIFFDTGSATLLPSSFAELD
ncbi:MAG: tetratricopeptide repeat protein, partial [Bacteroidota bacterium]